jgi:hypothetical protein
MLIFRDNFVTINMSHLITIYLLSIPFLEEAKRNTLALLKKILKEDFVEE